MALSIFIAFFCSGTASPWPGGWRRPSGASGASAVITCWEWPARLRGVVYVASWAPRVFRRLWRASGHLLAGLPGPGLLALLTFFLSVVPVLGTSLVWGPAAFWLFNQGLHRLGHLHDHLGPWRCQPRQLRQALFISQGSNLPFILIFFGVLGGAPGLWIHRRLPWGPTLLAVGYRLVEEWSAGVETRPAAKRRA